MRGEGQAMEGTMAPRGTAESQIGFRESPDGSSLALGRPRYVAAVAAVAGFLFVLGFVMLYVRSIAAGNGNTGGALGMQLSGLLFLGLGVAMATAFVLQSGRWLVSVDETGIRLQRSHRRPKNLPWSSVTRIQHGPTPIRLGQYGVRLGDALCIDARHSISPIFLDAVRFRVGADDMDRMALVIKEIASRHGVPVEPFPMAGRKT